MRTIAPVVLHANPEDVARLIERIEEARETIGGMRRFGVEVETVLLLANRSTNGISRSLSIDMVVSGSVETLLIVPSLRDWPIVGVQDMDMGRLDPESARTALDEILRALKAREDLDDDPVDALARRIQDAASDWITALSIHKGRLLHDLNDDGGWSVIVERDSMTGTPFVLVMQDSFSEDVRIDGELPEEVVDLIVRNHPVRLDLTVIDDLAIMNPDDLNGPLAFVSDDPIEILRRTARFLDERP